MTMTDTARAARAAELARQIKVLADTPREVGAEHSAAQSSLASLGVELANLLLETGATKGEEASA